MQKLVKSFMLTASLLGISLLYSHTVSANPVVRTATVLKQPLPAKERVVGTVKAVMHSEVAATEAGAVVEVLVSEGDQVQQGQSMVIMDRRKLKVELDRLSALKDLKQAEQALAQAYADNAQADHLAYLSSAKREAISEQQLRQSKTRQLTTQAQLQAAEHDVKTVAAQIKHIQLSIQNSIIRAPFSGQVTRQYVQPGQWLAQGSPAVTLIATDKLEVWLDVPERFVSALLPLPDQLSIRIGDQLMEGDDLKLLKNVDVRARTFRLIAQLPSHSSIIPGMSAQAWVPNGGIEDLVSVPKDAIVQHGSHTLVYRVTATAEGEQAQSVAVNVLFYQGDLVALKSAELTPGDQVVVKGNERLRPGKVTAVPADKISD